MSLTWQNFSLFRILIPSWRFFEDAGDVPEVFYQVIEATHTSEWQALLARPRMTLTNLFLNSRTHIYLAAYGSVERLILEINEAKTPFDCTQSAAYKILEHLVREKVTLIPHSKDFQFRFKIQVSQTGSGQTSTESSFYCHLISEEHSVC